MPSCICPQLCRCRSRQSCVYSAQEWQPLPNGVIAAAVHVAGEQKCHAWDTATICPPRVLSMQDLTFLRQSCSLKKNVFMHPNSCSSHVARKEGTLGGRGRILHTVAAGEAATHGGRGTPLASFRPTSPICWQDKLIHFFQTVLNSQIPFK